MLMKDVFTPENIYQNVCINNASREEALECTELWDLENGRTLCVPCHKLTDTYGGRCVKFLS